MRQSAPHPQKAPRRESSLRGTAALTGVRGSFHLPAGKKPPGGGGAAGGGLDKILKKLADAS